MVAGDNQGVAFLWANPLKTSFSTAVSLGTLAGGFSSYAFGVSADGKVVVGESTNAVSLPLVSTYQAFRWTAATGMVGLGTLGGDSGATAVSADGTVAVGYSRSAAYGYFDHAVSWTGTKAPVDLMIGSSFAALPGAASQASGVSSNGSVIVGSAFTNAGSSQAFRWTTSTGMVGLGGLGGGYSAAHAVSADGSIIVGNASVPAQADTNAFRWTSATGMQNLNTLLGNAGVNMSGIVLTDATGISGNGQYIIGSGNFTGTTEPYLVCYSSANGCASITTASSLRSSIQQLADDQRAALIESRATASEMLGMTRPVDSSNYVYAGAMLGSAVAYTGGQYSARGVTVLGGIGYGTQDYTHISEQGAPTIALAARYTFDDPFGDEGNALHPYGEIGGWTTPQATMTMHRSYSYGLSTGVGNTETTSWADYGRGGLIWDITSADRLTGYGEVGQQAMAFGAYSEQAGGTNPFPASVNGGLLNMGVARVGSSWTHKIDTLSDTFGKVPVAVTFAGDVARSFAVHSGLHAVSAIGDTASSANTAETWGEFGGRLSAELTKNLSLDFDVNGTTGGDALGTSFHGGMGVSYAF